MARLKKIKGLDAFILAAKAKGLTYMELQVKETCQIIKEKEEQARKEAEKKAQEEAERKAQEEAAAEQEN